MRKLEMVKSTTLVSNTDDNLDKWDEVLKRVQKHGILNMEEQ